jgi:hypothetical protein
MTAEEQACEEHFLTHTTQQPDGRFEFRLPTKMESPINLELLAPRQSADYMQLNTGWKEIRTQGSVPQLHEGI